MLGEIQRYKITYILIILNVVVYVYTSFLSLNPMDMNLEVLVDMGALYGPYVLEQGQWWRLLSAMFLHAGATHLFMNMFSLYLVGRGAEIYFDGKAYISIYILAGFIGAFSSLYMHPQSVGVGASGAIFGAFGALAGFFVAHREGMASHSKAFMKDFAIIIGINLVIGFSIPSVDVSAHFGGLMAGFIGGFILAKNPKSLSLYIGLMLAVMLVFYFYLSA